MQYVPSEFAESERRIRFSYHSPNPDQIERMAVIRAAFSELCDVLNRNCPPATAELHLAIEHLELASFYANAGIVRRESGRT